MNGVLYELDVEGLSCPLLVAARRKKHAAVAADVLAAQPCVRKGGTFTGSVAAPTPEDPDAVKLVTRFDPDAPSPSAAAADDTPVVLYRHRWEGAKHTREVVARLTLGGVRPGKPADLEKAEAAAAAE
jgi:hypothetical protein